MNYLYLESELKMPLLVLPLRSTAIKTLKGVILHSPIDFTPDQLKLIKQFGEVTDLVAPSVLHHLYVRKAMGHFPKAQVWGVEGVEIKQPTIAWKFLLKDPWPYENEIELKMIDGAPGMKEVDFFCKEDRLLIVVDLCFNLQNPKGAGAFALLKMLGTHKKFAVSRLTHMYIKDKELFKKSVQDVMKWNFEQIVMSHGDRVESQGHAMLESAFRERGILS